MNSNLLCMPNSYIPEKSVKDIRSQKDIESISDFQFSGNTADCIQREPCFLMTTSVQRSSAVTKSSESRTGTNDQSHKGAAMIR